MFIGIRTTEDAKVQTVGNTMVLDYQGPNQKEYKERIAGLTPNTGYNIRELTNNPTFLEIGHYTPEDVFVMRPQLLLQLVSSDRLEMFETSKRYNQEGEEIQTEQVVLQRNGDNVLIYAVEHPQFQVRVNEKTGEMSSSGGGVVSFILSGTRVKASPAQ